MFKALKNYSFRDTVPLIQYSKEEKVPMIDALGGTERLFFSCFWFLILLH